MSRKRDKLKRVLYEEVRYEVGRWPLWRWDQNLRYIAKSFAHRPAPLSAQDGVHHRAMARYLGQTLRWPESAADGWSCAAVGDLMWLRDGYRRFLSEDLQAGFAKQDMIFANLETPVDPSVPVKRWVYETLHYNAPTQYLDAWDCAGGATRVFSLCNNHALDQGLVGLKATRAQVEQRAGFLAVGGAERGEAVRTFEHRGLKVAVIATTFGINGAPPAAVPDGVPVVAFGDPRAETDWEMLGALVAQARAEDPDWVVMMPHWGFEYEYWPDKAMRADAYRLIEMGVDIIVGSSPHVLQPVEVISVDGWDASSPVQLRRQSGRPRPGVIAYSLGNFASIIPTVACQTGGVLRMSLDRQTVTALSFEPTVCMRGLGQGWLDARVLTLDEYRRRPLKGRPWQLYADHARTIMGPLMGP